MLKLHIFSDIFLWFTQFLFVHLHFLNNRISILISALIAEIPFPPSSRISLSIPKFPFTRLRRLFTVRISIMSSHCFPLLKFLFAHHPRCIPVLTFYLSIIETVHKSLEFFPRRSTDDLSLGWKSNSPWKWSNKILTNFDKTIEAIKRLNVQFSLSLSHRRAFQRSLFRFRSLPMYVCEKFVARIKRFQPANEGWEK